MPRKTSTQKSKKTTKPVVKKVVAARRPSSKKAKTSSEEVTPQLTQSVVNTNARNPRLWIGLAIVVLAVLAFAFKGLFVAAVVNGQPISRLAVIQQLEQQNGKQALDSLVTQTLIFDEAKKQKVTVSQSDVDADLKRINDALKAQGQTLDTALAARGLSKNDLIQQITLQKLVEKMVGKNVKVTDDDVAKYIDTNKDNLPQDLSEDQLKAQVKQQLQQQQLQEKTQTFVANLQKKAKISYFVGY